MGCFIYYFFWCIGLRSQVKALYWSNYFARHILLFFFLQSSFPLFLSQIYTFAIPVFVWCVLWHLFFSKNNADLEWMPKEWFRINIFHALRNKEHVCCDNWESDLQKTYRYWKYCKIWKRKKNSNLSHIVIS